MEKLKLDEIKTKRIHFIGIGGISMSSLALMLFEEGVFVQGSDASQNEQTEILREKGIKIFHGHSEENIKNAEVVCYSSAIQNDNPEMDFARKNNLIILKRAELLGMIAESFKTVIAVSGSHGKTTTTAMIAEIFVRANLRPTLHIGGVDKLVGSNFMIGLKDYFILEACEYKNNFHFIKPDIAVVLNVDADHLDFFGSIDGVKRAFLKFAKGTKKGGIQIACFDEENSSEILKLDDTVSFGLNKKADIHAVNVKEYKKGYYEFEPVFFGLKLSKVKLNILGKHNVLNALASIMVGMSCMIDFDTIKNALENFQGTGRRCEKVGEINGAEVYHDYAHHPKQIEKMMEVGKSLVKSTKGKIIVLFEPHTYSRTKFLLGDFAKSFEGVDVVIFAPAYSARENKSEGFEADVLAKETGKFVKEVLFIETYDEIKKQVGLIAKTGDVVLILGAGTIEKLAYSFKE